MRQIFFSALLFIVAAAPLCAQPLQPGFSTAEYRELMLVSVRATASEAYSRKFPEPQAFRPLYASPIMGLDNRYDLYTSPDGRTLVISIRGTTQSKLSWLANLYSAMVPARGTLALDRGDSFNYTLSEHPRAAVHVGWLLSTGYLVRDMVPRITSAVESGTTGILVVGHSQGGAIAYLLTAHLRSLQRVGGLPAAVAIKTYCSASPKPGNLYFAYDYERQTAGGWAFNVVNSEDWVPETPVSVQTVRDFNSGAPFANARRAIRKQGFPQRLVIGYVYGRLDGPTRRAQRAFQRYLGTQAGKQVKKSLPDFTPPQEYAPTTAYVRTGQHVVLYADSAYFQKFPRGEGEVFRHHLHEPYLWLLQRDKEAGR